MLNPSTADETENDPTVRRCIGFAQEWKCGSLEVVNIFAYRSTDPKKLEKVPDPVGPDNDNSILKAAHRADIVVAAWGTWGRVQDRGEAVRRLLESCDVHHLGLTKAGYPKHPLYLRADTKPILWKLPENP